MTDDLDERRDLLYGGTPDDFVRLRKELSSAAKRDGDAELARRVTALRKPTLAASIVNRLALADDTVVPRLRDVGDRLRAAQDDPDGINPALLRELSTKRRTLVRDLTAAALDASGSSVGATTRDEVQQTLDAAVADPDVADRLGQLTRAEQWSGFGAVSLRGAPATEKPAARRTAQKTVAAKSSESNRRTPRSRPSGPSAAERALAKADAAVAEADEQVAAAEQQEAGARSRVDDLTARVEQAQADLDAAERAAAGARRAVRAAHARRREAETARTRAVRRSRA